MKTDLNEAFLPKKLRFWFGDVWCLADREWNLYICWDKELDEPLECSEIIVTLDQKAKEFNKNGIIDIIPREIKLSKGDILHFEYKLDVKFW